MLSRTCSRSRTVTHTLTHTHSRKCERLAGRQGCERRGATCWSEGDLRGLIWGYIERQTAAVLKWFISAETDTLFEAVRSQTCARVVWNTVVCVCFFFFPPSQICHGTKTRPQSQFAHLYVTEPRKMWARWSAFVSSQCVQEKRSLYGHCVCRCSLVQISKANQKKIKISRTLPGSWIELEISSPNPNVLKNPQS